MLKAYGVSPKTAKNAAKKGAHVLYMPKTPMKPFVLSPKTPKVKPSPNTVAMTTSVLESFGVTPNTANRFASKGVRRTSILIL